MTHWEDGSGTEWAVWQTTETEEFFRSALTLHEEEMREIDVLNDRKKYEWLSSRYLLHMLSGREIRGACLKDEYGKPYLTNSDYFISLSHSRDMVAAIASPQVCGIDIQYKVDKIYRIKDRFVSDREKETCFNGQDENTVLHVLWGAKESMYKGYGKKGLDFRSQMQVEAFDITNGYGKTTGKVTTGETEQYYDLRFRILQDLVIVYAIHL